MSQVMKATEVRVHFGEVMRRVSKGGSPIIVERAGQPLVAIISLTDHDRLERLQAGSNVWARARAARQRIQKERAGQPLPNPTEVLRQVSEERVEQLSSLDR
jgi:prevent-host-death family protein